MHQDTPSHSTRKRPTSQPIQPLKLAQRPAATGTVPQTTVPKNTIPKTAVPQIILPKNAVPETISPASPHPPIPPSFSCKTLRNREVPIASPSLLLRPRKPWQWAVTGLVAVIGIFGGVGTASMLWLTSLPPMPQCEEVTVRSLDTQRLFCAQEAAHSGKLGDLILGINLLKDWSADHPLQGEAQRLLSQWSEDVLSIAQSQIQRNDLTGAVATAAKIPPASPLYQQAQQAIARWQTEWQTGKTLTNLAQQAMQKQDWSNASRQVQSLGKLEHAYWRINRADELSQLILKEQQARRILTEAQKIAKIDQSQLLTEAIAQLRQIPPGTYAAKEAEKSLNQWSQALLALALKQWQQGNMNGAMAIAQTLPTDPRLSVEVQDFVRFSQAQKLVAASQKGWEPNLGQIWSLMEAIAAVQEVSPKSSFYAQVLTYRQNWQAQMHNLVQLQYASWAAESGQPQMLNFAIAQAQRIAPQQPRRVQAQAMVARWRRGLETLEDSPYLDRGIQLAKGNSRVSLQAAIAQASQIHLGRTLRTQAQTYIAQWRQQLQTLEDQPTWQQAQAFADQGLLIEAIQTASKIQPRRALYAQAQAAIAHWQSAQNPVEPAASAQSQPSDPQPYWVEAPASEPYNDRSEAQPTEAAVPTISEPAIASSDGVAPIAAESEPVAAIDPEPADAPLATEPAANDASSDSFEGYYDERYFGGSQ